MYVLECGCVCVDTCVGIFLCFDVCLCVYQIAITVLVLTGERDFVSQNTVGESKESGTHPSKVTVMSI